MKIESTKKGIGTTSDCDKAVVSGSIKELNHYCRRRDCVFHNGISKRENVMCSHKKPDVVSDKDGMKRCFSYCH